MRATVQQTQRGLVVMTAAALLLVGCSSDGGDAGGGATGASTLPAGVVVQAGTQEITVTGLAPASSVTIIDASGAPRLTLISDDQGQAHTGYLPTDHLTVTTGGDNVLPTGEGESLKPGEYTVVVGQGDGAPRSAPLQVGGVDDHPDAALYERQPLDGVPVGVLGEPVEGATVEDGFQYLEMRDGVKLSAMVRLPDPTIYGDGPYPTVIEYSGYDPISNPENQEPGSRITQALGFATVGVAMRGTGCSGGAFDVFSPAQQADGYDAIEIVARQPWVKGNKVGMVGLSYSGIGQMYAASTAPPSLAAVAPQSIIVDPWLAQWPGGIYNDGFTKQWLAERDKQAAADGVGWVAERSAGADATCADNLELRSQNIDFESFGRSLEFRPPDSAERDLRELAKKIDVPVFLTGAFQDEQTGPVFTNMIDHFESSPLLRVSMWNGRHPDGYSPMNVNELFEFLSLYVDETVPHMNDLLRVGLPVELANAFELEDATIAPDRLFEQFGDDYEAARAFYEDEPPVRIVFESGAGENEVGEPGGTFEQRFGQWPVEGAPTATWYLDADGTLVDSSPTATGLDGFAHDPDASGEDFFGEEGYQQQARLWDFDWTEFAQGNQLSYVTDPLAEDLVLGGPGEVTLYVGSEADDADLQVTLSEVRPDGNEYLLQVGFLRASARAVDEERTRPLRVDHVWTAEAAEPLPAGEEAEVRISLPSVAAPVRAGSRLRLQVSSPGRNHGTWLFEDLFEGAAPRHRVGRGGTEASAITLTVLDGIAVPAAYPPCPGLRGQPCRPYLPVTNEPGT